jgi:threonyl-tRNA synthetase
VATITSDADEYAGEVTQSLNSAGLRALTDTRNEKINYKVREHSLAKVPVIIAVGKREMTENTVAIRRLGANGQRSMDLAEAIASLRDEARMPEPQPQEGDTHAFA